MMNVFIVFYLYALCFDDNHNNPESSCFWARFQYSFLCVSIVIFVYATAFFGMFMVYLHELQMLCKKNRQFQIQKTDVFGPLGSLLGTVAIDKNVITSCSYWKILQTCVENALTMRHSFQCLYPDDTKNKNEQIYEYRQGFCNYILKCCVLYVIRFIFYYLVFSYTLNKIFVFLAYLFSPIASIFYVLVQVFSGIVYFLCWIYRPFFSNKGLVFRTLLTLSTCTMWGSIADFCKDCNLLSHMKRGDCYVDYHGYKAYDMSTAQRFPQRDFDQMVYITFAETRIVTSAYTNHPVIAFDKDRDIFLVFDPIIFSNLIKKVDGAWAISDSKVLNTGNGIKDFGNTSLTDFFLTEVHYHCVKTTVFEVTPRPELSLGSFWSELTQDIYNVTKVTPQVESAINSLSYKNSVMNGHRLPFMLDKLVYQTFSWLLSLDGGSRDL